MDFKGSKNGQSLNIDILLSVIATIIIYFRSDVAYLRSKVIAFYKVLLQEKETKNSNKRMKNEHMGWNRGKTVTAYSAAKMMLMMMNMIMVMMIMMTMTMTTMVMLKKTKTIMMIIMMVKVIMITRMTMMMMVMMIKKKKIMMIIMMVKVIMITRMTMMMMVMMIKKKIMMIIMMVKAMMITTMTIMMMMTMMTMMIQCYLLQAVRLQQHYLHPVAQCKVPHNRFRQSPWLTQLLLFCWLSKSCSQMVRLDLLL